MFYFTKIVLHVLWPLMNKPGRWNPNISRGTTVNWEDLFYSTIITLFRERKKKMKTKRCGSYNHNQSPAQKKLDHKRKKIDMRSGTVFIVSQSKNIAPLLYHCQAFCSYSQIQSKPKRLVQNFSSIYIIHIYKNLIILFSVHN